MFISWLMMRSSSGEPAHKLRARRLLTGIKPSKNIEAAGGSRFLSQWNRLNEAKHQRRATERESESSQQQSLVSAEERHHYGSQPVRTRATSLRFGRALGLPPSSAPRRCNYPVSLPLDGQMMTMMMMMKMMMMMLLERSPVRPLACRRHAHRRLSAEGSRRLESTASGARTRADRCERSQF